MQFIEPNLSIEIIPYREMPNKEWLTSSLHDDWFYHKPRTKLSIPDPHTLHDTLDPAIRDLAMKLNSLGYPTLPSCAGHHKQPMHYSKIYDALSRDCDYIRTRGIHLVDTENAETPPLLFKNANWSLPWDRKTFIAKAGGTFGKPEGYLAFGVPPGKNPYDVLDKTLWASFNIPGCRSYLDKNPFSGDPVVVLRAVGKDDNEQAYKWGRLAARVLWAMKH